MPSKHSRVLLEIAQMHSNQSTVFLETAQIMHFKESSVLLEIAQMHS